MSNTNFTQYQQNMINYINQIGGSNKINFTANDLDEHLQILTKEILFDYFKQHIQDFYYLEEQEWFQNNPSLQKKLYQVCEKGLSKEVNVVSIFFSDHLNILLESSNTK